MNHKGVSARRARLIIQALARPEYKGLPEKELATLIDVANGSIYETKLLYHWGHTLRLPIKKIKQSDLIQPRAMMDEITIAQFAEYMKDGAIFPPPVVYFDAKNYWLADGFHRVAAAIYAGLTSIDVEVKQGTKREALYFSATSNTKHGQQRTSEDKRRCVLKLLSDKEWRQWSDRKIAEKCGVSYQIVRELRHNLSATTSQIDSVARSVRRGNSQYEMSLAQRRGRGDRVTHCNCWISIEANDRLREFAASRGLYKAEAVDLILRQYLPAENGKVDGPSGA